jgi:prepilin-type N-terminal cleavage/methylation domain-containing protein
MKNKTKGFTLIELLVVISIISLLSSIVLSALTATRGKAEIAKALQFDASVKHAIGDQMVEELLFSGNLSDTSGVGSVPNTGTINYTLDVQGAAGQAFYFNGNNDYLEGTAKTELTSIINNVDSFSMGLWFKTNSSPATEKFLLLLRTNTGNVKYGLKLQPDGTLIFKMENVFLSQTRSIVSSKKLNDDKWHYVLAVWDKPTTTMKLYVDGILDNKASVTSVTGESGPAVFDVSYGALTFSADSVRIYSTAY